MLNSCVYHINAAIIAQLELDNYLHKISERFCHYHNVNYVKLSLTARICRSVYYYEVFNKE